MSFEMLRAALENEPGLDSTEDFIALPIYAVVDRERSPREPDARCSISSERQVVRPRRGTALRTL